MARKEMFVTMPAEFGRDAGKVFHLQEADAFRADRWANRANWIMIQNGVPIDPALKGAGLLGFFAGVAVLASAGAALRNIDYDRDIEPLYREMFDCVQAVPDPTNPDLRRPLMQGAGDIEEASTYSYLRGEIMKLHWGFTAPGGK